MTMLLCLNDCFLLYSKNYGKNCLIGTIIGHFCESNYVSINIEIFLKNIIYK